MSQPEIERLDHLIGHHDEKPSDGCPLCHPESFTAAPDRETVEITDAVDYFGLNEPMNPRLGDVWHEPGHGVWMWVRQKEGDLWVNALNMERVRDGQMAFPLSIIEYHPSARRLGMTYDIAESLIAKSPMGLNPREEARSLNLGRLAERLRDDGLVAIAPVEHMESRVISLDVIRISATLLARPRFTFASTSA